eukprot:SAG25_NODE_3835_length_954_cov_1.446784_2_plen_22_part_01
MPATEQCTRLSTAWCGYVYTCV